MTPFQAKAEIRAGLKAMGKTRVLLERMATQMRADQLERVFSEGKNEGASNIGSYRPSTAKIRTKYGRPVDKVNLDFTGQTKASYVTDVLTDSKAVLGFIEINRRDIRGKSVDTQTSEVVGFITDKYGDVFNPTDQELENMNLVIEDFFDEIEF